MKKLEAVIRPDKLDEIMDALNSAGIKGYTVSQVMGCGLQGGRKEYFRGTEVTIRLLPKVKIEIIVLDENLEKAIAIISTKAFTGKVGDGKLFIYAIEDVVRIRTGERGESAV